MYERRNIARRTGSSAMQHLLEVLNTNFKQGRALPDCVKNETERVERARVQDRLLSLLAPILGFVHPQPDLSAPDPEHVRRLQVAISKYQKSKDAKIHGQQKTVECPICHRRLTIPINARVRCSHSPDKGPDDTVPPSRPPTCEDGLRGLALELNEWASEAKVYPRWQVDDNQLPDPPSTVPAKQRDPGGKKVVTASQGFNYRPTLKNLTMLNLGACLVNGELARLRLCAEGTCRRYFYARDFRRKTCSRACYRLRDKVGARPRMRLFRERQRTADAALKAYALATLPKLHMRMLRAFAKQRVLTEREIDVLDGMREKVEEGTPLERIWELSGSRARGVFRKLQAARAL